MKLLITGFEPFGGETINPAWEAVRALPERVGEWELTKLRVSTVFGLAASQVIDAANKEKPDAILCVGQAGGRDAVTPEMTAINLRYASIADNDGNRPQDEPIVPQGPAAYFSTLPARKMAAAIAAFGLPGKVSYSAGTFVCNDLFYSLLHHYSASSIKVGFIHVPFLPEQGVPCLPLEKAVSALKEAVLAIAE